MAAIYNMTTGNVITEGLQGCYVCDEAIQMAQRLADEFGDDVWLADDDGDWIVHPMRDGEREAADPYDPNADDQR